MGDIAEALRKANEPVDGGEVMTDQTARNDDETSGEITAALRRAKKTTTAKKPQDDPDRPAHTPREPRGRGTYNSPHVFPNRLGRVIFHVEQHRHLGLRLRTVIDRTPARSLAVVSALRNEGKSITSCNVAAAIASLSSERSVALLDLDLRNPSIAQMLGIEVSVGIEQVLQGRAKLDEVRMALSEPEIDVYPCAQPHRAAHELLVLPTFEALVHELEARYSAVVIDTPPTLLVPDSTLIMRSVGHCLAVARAGETRVHRFTEMLDRLPREKLLGKVINNVPLPSHARDYYYSNQDTK